MSLIPINVPPRGEDALELGKPYGKEKNGTSCSSARADAPDTVTQTHTHTYNQQEELSFWLDNVLQCPWGFPAHQFSTRPPDTNGCGTLGESTLLHPPF